MSKHVDPNTDKTAFTCPHCGAYTTQYWFHLRAHPFQDNDPHPRFIPPDADWDEFRRTLKGNLPKAGSEDVERVVAATRRLATGRILIDDKGEYPWSAPVHNCYLSRCWHCKKVTVWVHRRVVDPVAKLGALPNKHMPPEIAKDFDEARSILNLSPRGAAALLRLCVEKLCDHLGAKGKTIDDKIGYLVGKGLDEGVKDALDVVRVIGNNAVHVGKLDVGDDDPNLASQLLDLVNEIVEEMISKPSRLKAMKAKIPQGARDAIEKRDAKAKGAGSVNSGNASNGASTS
ncbi:MAG: DUF4145 domain-containing protein [Planctomycetota bacterium]|nr:DUF4145 domain-containing protein [Planctomycetota bacterium]